MHMLLQAQWRLFEQEAASLSWSLQAPAGLARAVSAGVTAHGRGVRREVRDGPAPRGLGNGPHGPRPGLGHGGNGVDEAGMGAGLGEGGEKDAKVEVVDVELVAAIGVGRVDPLATAEEPTSSFAVW